jgi:ATP/maltotriose-dependent transcriptional regulator MalT
MDEPSGAGMQLQVLDQLINEIIAIPSHFVLVLDDYHMITTPSVHQALTFLLDRLPEQMHLILASRIDPPLPLSRLRVRQQMMEIRVADLCYTPKEAAAFLQEVMGLGLSAQDTATLEARTEGWIAGLQLAALSLRGHVPHQRGISLVPGLYLIGRSWQWTRGSALLTGVGDDALYLIEHLLQQLEGDTTPREATKDTIEV